MEFFIASLIHDNDEFLSKVVSVCHENDIFVHYTIKREASEEETDIILQERSNQPELKKRKLDQEKSSESERDSDDEENKIEKLYVIIQEGVVSTEEEDSIIKEFDEFNFESFPASKNEIEELLPDMKSVRRLKILDLLGYSSFQLRYSKNIDPSWMIILNEYYISMDDESGLFNLVPDVSELVHAVNSQFEPMKSLLGLERIGCYVSRK